jgi:hypothetical protein
MEHTNAANCLICKKPKVLLHVQTLMHEPNKELYVLMFVVIAKQYSINPVLPEILKDYYTENYLPYRGSLAWGKYFSL